MKLLNYTGIYFVGILMLIISIWAVIFYFIMLDEIYDSIDDGLDNQKGLVIQKAATDTATLYKNNFDETDYAIHEISPALAVDYQDTYIDTMMYMQNEQSDEPVRLLKTVFLQNGKYYQLQVATSMVEEDDLIKQLFYSLIWLYLSLIVVVIVLNNFLLKKIWRPFYHLLGQLKKFRLDKKQLVKTTATNVDEFGLLNDTVTEMLQRNIDTYNSQKAFIENAAHELQTPLAISINKLEMLTEKHSLPQEQLTIVADVMDNLERLARLNKSLLLISKIENRQFAEETPVDFNALIKQTIADFSDLADYHTIKINLSEQGIFTRTMNADLAAIFVLNLLKNALLHNEANGFVNIRIQSSKWTIENSGNKQALDSQKIFDRFHSGQPSASSSGLGLSIVKTIADLYGLKINYQFNGYHKMEISY